jgi:hypothetical protein
MESSAVTNDLLRRIFDLLETMEAAQRQKVIELARRLHPGLTAEDIQNPHDFPDLDDPDWHFEDGQLAGIQAVLFALRAMSSDVLDHDEAAQGTAQERHGGPDRDG